MDKETILNLIRGEQRKAEEGWWKVSVYALMNRDIEQGKKVSLDDFQKYSEELQTQTNRTQIFLSGLEANDIVKEVAHRINKGQIKLDWEGVNPRMYSKNELEEEASTELPKNN